jgi:hypothetical protein
MNFEQSRLRIARVALVAAATVTLAAAAVPSALADGGGPKAKTKIAIKTLTNNGASGTLSSKENACLKNRKVSLFRLDDFVSVKIEITYSNSNGKWKTKKDLQDGEYFSKVDAAQAGGTECLYAVSKNSQL